MASSIDSAPDLLRPAGQPLIFKFSTSATVTAGFRFAVRVYESTTTAVGSVIGTFYITPNASEEGYFDLSDIAEGRVAAPNTYYDTGASANAVVHTATANQNLSLEAPVLYYRVGVQDYTGGTLGSDDATADIYLLGGAQQISQGLHPSFSAYYPTTTSTKGWLTDRILSNKNITMTMADEDEGVGVICHTTNLGTISDWAGIEFNLYKDGSIVQQRTYAVTASAVMASNYFIFPIGPANLQPAVFVGLWDPDWDQLRIYATDSASAGGSKRSGTLIINRDCRPIKHDPVQLAWANTVGAWDYLRFDGRNLKTLATESKDYRQSVGFDFKAWDRQATPYHKTGKESYQLRNQLFTSDERDLLQYAFRSKNVMFRVGSGDWLPCNIVTNTYQVIPAASKTFDVSFQIELAQDIRC
jgi:hypothetical protein